MSVSVLSWLLIACRIDLMVTAEPIHAMSLRGPTSTHGRETAHLCQPTSSLHASSPSPTHPTLEPILFPKLQIYFADFTYIVLSTRGCSPWRPAAVMSTTRQENDLLARIFKGCRQRTLWLNRFQGNFAQLKKKRTLPGAPADVSEFGCVAAGATRWQYPCSGSGILTPFPFDRRSANGTLCNGISLSLRID